MASALKPRRGRDPARDPTRKRSFRPLSRRSFGSIEISDSSFFGERESEQLHLQFARSDVDTPETGDIEYFQNEKYCCDADSSELFAGD